MYVLIGASSFIGVHTAREFLNNGSELLVTGRNGKFREYYESLGVEYVDFDLASESDIAKLPTEGAEGVILAAGLLPANAEADLNEEENAADYFKLNTIATINLLEYCRKNGVKRLLSFSSYADVIESWSASRALTEEEPRSYRFTGDHAVYVFSKNACTDVMEYYNQQHGMHNVMFRLPPVIGVGPHGSLLINGVRKKSGFQIFMDKAVAGETITIYGDGNLARDIVSVKDVAHAVYLAMHSENASGLYNMTAGRTVTLREQAEVIAEVFATDQAHVSDIVLDSSTPNSAPSFLFSMEKAKRDFGFEPQFKDFRKFMLDYKRDLDAGLYKDLFGY